MKWHYHLKWTNLWLKKNIPQTLHAILWACTLVLYNMCLHVHTQCRGNRRHNLYLHIASPRLGLTRSDVNNVSTEHLQIKSAIYPMPPLPLVFYECLGKIRTWVTLLSLSIWFLAFITPSIAPLIIFKHPQTLRSHLRLAREREKRFQSRIAQTSKFNH